MKAAKTDLLRKILMPVLAVVLSLARGAVISAAAGRDPLAAYGYLLRENQICRTDGEELIVYIDLTQQNLDGAQLLRILPLTGGKLLLLWSDGFTVCTPTLE